MGLPTDQPFSLNADQVVWRQAGDELVVLEIGTATYLTINGSGRLLWERLAEGATLDALIEALVEHYGVAHDQAVQDVQSFAAALAERSLLAPGRSADPVEP